MRHVKSFLLVAVIASCEVGENNNYENLKVSFSLSDYEEEYKSNSNNTFNIDSSLFYSRLKERLSYKENVKIIIVSEIRDYKITLKNRNELLNQDLGPSFSTIQDLEVKKDETDRLSFIIDGKQEIEIEPHNRYNFLYIFFYESAVHIELCYSKCIGLH